MVEVRDTSSCTRLFPSNPVAPVTSADLIGQEK
jgi:hypothetical protein